MFFPANADEGIAVSATDNTNNITSFSNFGPYISLGAPGSNVLTTFPQYSTPIGATNYAGFTGTSAAAPQVSSVAAMLVMSTPNTSAAAIAQRLQQTASSAGWWNQNTGYGVVNAFNAVTGNLQPSSLGGIRGQVTNNYGIPAGTAQVNVNGNVATLDSSGLYHFVDLPAGDYTITVSLSGYPNQTVTAAIVPGADTELPIVIGANYGRFSGSVTDGNGAAVVGAIVQAMSNGVVTATAVADQYGQYNLWVPAGGTYNLRTTQIGRQTSTVSSVWVGSGGNTGVNLTLPKLPAITGTVVNANSQGVANAQLFITGGGINAGATADGNGNFSTIGLPAGNYSITATASGQPNTTLNLSISNSLQGLIIHMGGTAPPPPPPVSISINPGGASVNQGGTAQFYASVQNASNTGVIWSLSPAVGSVNANGFYQAPGNISQNQNITISATSVQDYTKSASATISLIAPPPPPPPPTPPVTINSVAVSPAAITVLQGNQQQFTAMVNGSVSSAVTWTISPPLGTITSNGLYSAPGSVSSMQIVSVKAASTVNPAKSLTTILFLVP